MRILCGLVLSALVALASPYGYNYARNPYSGQCQLQLVRGGGWTGQKYYYVYPGTNYGYYTYGKYGSDAGTSYYGAASSLYNPLNTGSLQVSKTHASSDKNSYSAGNYAGSNLGVYGVNGGSYGKSSGNYGGLSNSNSYGGSVGNKYESSNYGGSYGGDSGNHYGSNAEYDSYGNKNKYGSSSSSSSHGSSLNSGSYAANERDTDRNYESPKYPSTNRETSYGATRDRYYDRNPAGNNYGTSSSSYNNNRNTGSKYGGGSFENDRDRDTDYYGSSGYDREKEVSYSQTRPGSSSSSYGSSSSSKFGTSDSPSGNRGSSGGSSYNRESSRSKQSSSSSSGSRGGGSSYGGSSSSGENYGGDRSWNKQQATDADNGEYLKKEFANEVLKTHNSYRARHTTPPVTLDEQMSIKAQEWAYDLASGRVPYGHSPEAVEGTYGESLKIVDDPSATGKEVVRGWYEEKFNYDFGKPQLVKKPASISNSHFAAIVWKSTRKIGVGKALSKDGRTFVVVNYFPPGNIVDVLEDNVLPSRGGGR